VTFRVLLTKEDQEILWGGYRDIPVALGRPVRNPLWIGILAGVARDESDAALMYLLVRRPELGTAYLRIGRENIAVPAIHAFLRFYEGYIHEQTASLHGTWFW
jgi:hypothetical protein